MDSQYAMNAVTKWLPGWKRNGWKTSAGKPVANRELVVGIDELMGAAASPSATCPRTRWTAIR